jgi:hypothetical protein
MEIFIYFVISGIDVPGYFICLTQKKSSVIFVISEKHRQCQKLQQQKADESKISADK